MHRSEGMTAAQIAEELGVHVTTVITGLSRRGLYQRPPARSMTPDRHRLYASRSTSARASHAAYAANALPKSITRRGPSIAPKIRNPSPSALVLMA
jgi:hypothetical protein